MNEWNNHEESTETQSIHREMVRLYYEKHGWENIHEAYKVLLPIKPDKIGIEMFSEIEDLNDKEMQKRRLCTTCGIEVVYSNTERNAAMCPRCEEIYPEYN